MSSTTYDPGTASDRPAKVAPAAGDGMLRLNSADLFRQAKAVEIEHEGRVYELRLTRLNKLILTA